MPDDFIVRPAGPSGPRARAHRLDGATDAEDLYQTYVVRSVPWRVDRTFRSAQSQFASTTATATWPLLIGYPTTALDNQAMVIRYFRLGMQSNGTLGSDSRIDVALATAVQTTGGSSGTQLSDIGLRANSSSPAHTADIRTLSTGTKGAVLRSYNWKATATQQYDPYLFPPLDYSRGTGWLDAPVLGPGEWFGCKFEPGVQSVPSTNDRIYWELIWSEVTL